jgi:hypothetical protein
MKKLDIVLLVLIVTVVAVSGLEILKNKKVPNKIVSDYKNATYIIDGQLVTLVNGRSEVPSAPGSASKIITQYFGNEVSYDFDGDGRTDVAFLLTQSTDGSGTFYYVVAALNTVNGYVGSSGLLLGDRIAPQTTEMSQNPNTPNVIVVNYADRNPGESFAVAPSLGKSIWLLLDPKTMQFGEVAQNFEGESAGLEVKLYFYNPALDQGPGGAQCTKKGLVSERRAIPNTTTPLADTIKLLLSEKISDADRALGIESEFPLAGVTLKSASIQNGIAILTFDDPQNKTGGGSCLVSIRWAQIEATAKQFESVKSVRFLPAELFQP